MKRDKDEYVGCYLVLCYMNENIGYGPYERKDGNPIVDMTEVQERFIKKQTQFKDLIWLVVTNNVDEIHENKVTIQPVSLLKDIFRSVVKGNSK